MATINFKTITNIYLGDEPMDALYSGETLVWQAGPRPAPLFIDAVTVGPYPFRSTMAVEETTAESIISQYYFDYMYRSGTDAGTWYPLPEEFKRSLEVDGQPTRFYADLCTLDGTGLNVEEYPNATIRCRYLNSEYVYGEFEEAPDLETLPPPTDPDVFKCTEGVTQFLYTFKCPAGYEFPPGVNLETWKYKYAWYDENSPQLIQYGRPFICGGPGALDNGKGIAGTYIEDNRATYVRLEDQNTGEYSPWLRISNRAP
jgi:hypothetical protein